MQRCAPGPVASSSVLLCLMNVVVKKGSEASARVTKREKSNVALTLLPSIMPWLNGVLLLLLLSVSAVCVLIVLSCFSSLDVNGHFQRPFLFPSHTLFSIDQAQASMVKILSDDRSSCLPRHNTLVLQGQTRACLSV